MCKITESDRFLSAALDDAIASGYYNIARSMLDMAGDTFALRVPYRVALSVAMMVSK